MKLVTIIGGIFVLAIVALFAVGPAIAEAWAFTTDLHSGKNSDS